MQYRSLAAFAATPFFLQAGQIRGVVTDGTSREPLARVEVRCENTSASARTGADGRFMLDIAEPGCLLRVSSVGYRPVTKNIEGAAEVEIELMPDTITRSQAVEVSAGPYAMESSGSLSLAGNELRNLSSVLADDPLRAVQALPGVTAQDDFQSQFALRGAGFDRIGVVMDGILLHSPFHSLQNNSINASLTNFPGEILEAANLIPGPIPSRFGDRSAGVLDLETRDGAPGTVHGRITGGTSNLAGSAEGSMGDNGTWLVSARQSYLQYILGLTSNAPGLAYGFRDFQTKLSYTLTPRNQVSLLLLDGTSGLDRNPAAAQLGFNTLDTTGDHSSTAIATWRYTPRSDLLITNRFAFLRELFDDRNKMSQPLSRGFYREWVWRPDVAKQWGPHASTQAGASLRRISENGLSMHLNVPPAAPAVLDSYGGAATLSSGYLQQSWSPLARLRLEAGVRKESMSIGPVRATLPFASAGVQMWKGGRITASFAEAAQFPEVSQYTSILGRRSLLPERSTQTQFSFEQMFGNATRLRLDVYNRQDRDLLVQPLLDPRIVAGQVFGGEPLAPWENSERGRARGVEIFLQRRSANRLSGWISYAYQSTHMSDNLLSLSYPSEFEARDSLRIFATYRLSATWNLSGRFVYATGLPLPGFLNRTAGITYLSSQPNLLRLPDYQRADCRVNKAVLKKRVQWTVFAEVVNLTDHKNLIFDDLSNYNVTTGQAFPNLIRTFPLLPAARMVLDF